MTCKGRRGAGQATILEDLGWEEGRRFQRVGKGRCIGCYFIEKKSLTLPSENGKVMGEILITYRLFNVHLHKI